MLEKYLKITKCEKFLPGKDSTNISRTIPPQTPWQISTAKNPIVEVLPGTFSSEHSPERFPRKISPNVS